LGKVQEKMQLDGYGVIIDHLGNVNLYKKEDAQQNKFMENLLFVAKTYMLIFVVKKQWSCIKILELCFQTRNK
jgi:hypothetical protein